MFIFVSKPKVFWNTLALLLRTTIAHTNAANSPAIHVDNHAFRALLGPAPQVVELASSNLPLFHEASVYHPPTKALWVVSDNLHNKTNRDISRVTGLGSAASVSVLQINHTIPTPVGGFRYVPGTPLGDVILFVAQGTTKPSPPGGVYVLNPYPPYNTSLLVGSYGDYPFNSPDDVTVTPDGVVWFTDPSYGYGEGNRFALPSLPNQVYSYDPATNDLRVVADGFGQPNGITFGNDGATAYIGDTGANIGNGTVDYQGPRTIYAYDRQGKFLGNRHVFAMPNAAGSAADGIKTDSQGNVWAGVNGEGLVVWNAEGTLLGSVELEKSENIGNLGFGEAGELFVLGGRKLFKVLVSQSVVGAYL